MSQGPIGAIIFLIRGVPSAAFIETHAVAQNSLSLYVSIPFPKSIFICSRFLDKLSSNKGFASLTICSILYEVTGTDSLDTQSLPAIHDKCVDGMMRTFSFSPPPHHHAEHAVEQIPIEAPSGHKLCSGAVHIGIA